MEARGSTAVNPLGRLTREQLAAARRRLDLDSDAFYALVDDGLLLLLMRERWQTEGWSSGGRRHQRDYDRTVWAIHEDGELHGRGYVVRGCASCAQYCGTPADPQPRATWGIWFRPLATDLDRL